MHRYPPDPLPENPAPGPGRRAAATTCLLAQSLTLPPATAATPAQAIPVPAAGARPIDLARDFERTSPAETPAMTVHVTTSRRNGSNASGWKDGRSARRRLAGVDQRRRNARSQPLALGAHRRAAGSRPNTARPAMFDEQEDPHGPDAITPGFPQGAGCSRRGRGGGRGWRSRARCPGGWVAGAGTSRAAWPLRAGRRRCAS